MAEFKLAISQHAIIHEFEYNTEKSAPDRFRAYCSRKDEDNCPWRLHASKIDDGGTVEVIIQPYQFLFCLFPLSHMCPRKLLLSRKRQKGK